MMSYCLITVQWLPVIYALLFSNCSKIMSRCSRCWEIILAVVQFLNGLAIVWVEGIIIRTDDENTPGAFKLLHQEVAVKGITF